MHICRYTHFTRIQFIASMLVIVSRKTKYLYTIGIEIIEKPTKCVTKAKGGLTKIGCRQRWKAKKTTTDNKTDREI